MPTELKSVYIVHPIYAMFKVLNYYLLFLHSHMQHTNTHTAHCIQCMIHSQTKIIKKKKEEVEENYIEKSTYTYQQSTYLLPSSYFNNNNRQQISLDWLPQQWKENIYETKNNTKRRPFDYYYYYEFIPIFLFLFDNNYSWFSCDVPFFLQLHITM